MDQNHIPDYIPQFPATEVLTGPFECTNFAPATDRSAVAPGNSFHVNTDPDWTYTFAPSSQEGAIEVHWKNSGRQHCAATYSMQAARDYVRDGKWVMYEEEDAAPVEDWDDEEPTIGQYEQYLDEAYEGKDPEAIMAELIYMTTPGRANGTLSEEELQAQIHIGNIGMLIGKYDPIRFNVGYRNYCANPK